MNASWNIDGLSPRARGIPRYHPDTDTVHGSIPACAGNTRAPRSQTITPAVYPRVRGEYGLVSAIDNTTEGLSPRARGIRITLQGPARTARSIPACAGNTGGGTTYTTGARVYPRVRGEYAFPASPSMDDLGLSPRARGIRVPSRISTTMYGSIPACAGNTATTGSQYELTTVYPRVRGEYRRSSS